MVKIKYSFIIPVKEINNYLRQCIAKILEIKGNDYEIIVYPDFIGKEKWRKTRQIASGPTDPAQKRTLAIRDAKGEILVFLDDDAYPKSNFLEILDKDFSDEKITAVGGPAITPPGNSFWQKVSGAVFLSILSGGFPERYISLGKKKLVDDWPSVNLSVRKTKFVEVNGFDSKFWTGEDTKFCLDLINKAGGKILYDPDLIVWHHRREGLFLHLDQVGRYGLHRGFFAKRYPQTSFKFKYFLPSLFFLFVAFGNIAAMFSNLALKLYLFGWSIYFLSLLKAFFDIKKYEKNTFVILHSFYYILFTHLVYGAKFIQGLLSEELKDKYK